MLVQNQLKLQKLRSETLGFLKRFHFVTSPLSQEQHLQNPFPIDDRQLFRQK